MINRSLLQTLRNPSVCPDRAMRLPQPALMRNRLDPKFERDELFLAIIVVSVVQLQDV